MRTCYTIPKFLTKKHCERLVERATASKLFQQDATISNKGVEKGAYRTSESFTLIDRGLFKKLVKALSLEVPKFERPMLVRYREGMEFKPHVDFHIPGTEHYEERVRNGQRSLAFIFYVNDDYEGGQLYFNKLDQTITPHIGDLVIIVNQFLDGQMNWESSHASLPIKKGTKYILLVNYTGKYEMEEIEKRAK